ncbi:prepilin peptidase [Skermanella sp. TT6]|uniref:Prepilin peptidase n=1 Tax=Skermanella cutis TaxID=2775420 RepID=A0ABX7BBG1_9PROT|nr:A24 family peptidase [Skermanella sp. TT6]QQP91732.1 prepilin peptidase [Skermanella sp. TT6]
MSTETDRNKQVDGLELLLIASAPLCGAIVGVLVDRYPAPPGGDDACLEGAEGQPATLRSLHPSIEAACTLAAILAAVLLPMPLSVFAAILGWALLGLALIDLRYLEVPDAVSLPLIPAGLAVTWWVEPQAVPAHAAAAAIGAGVIRLLGAAYRRIRGHEGIGGGDVRLFAVAGAWVGLAALPGVLFLSGVFGLFAAALLVRGGWVEPDGRIPFVPALSAALWVVFLVPELVQP